jgi:hypothetical protein
MELCDVSNATFNLLPFKSLEKLFSCKNEQHCPGTCNPSCSEGRDQEDLSSKPAPANSLQDPISKIFNTKKDWWSGSSGRA